MEIDYFKTLISVMNRNSNWVSKKIEHIEKDLDEIYDLNALMVNHKRDEFQLKEGSLLSLSDKYNVEIVKSEGAAASIKRCEKIYQKALEARDEKVKDLNTITSEAEETLKKIDSKLKELTSSQTSS